MKALSSTNPRLIELGFLLLILIILSFFSFPIASLVSLGFIWNWTALFDIEKVRTNKRYRFSTLKFVFILKDIFEKPLSSFPQYQWIARILPAGVFWIFVGWFMGSLDFWWAPFLGSALLEGIHFVINKYLVRS